MAVILSAASCVTWVTKLTGASDEGALIAEVEDAARRGRDFHDAPLFLPYLSGERTPHNDPLARGVFHGLSYDTGRVDLAWAVLEGVAFALADGQQALLDAGTRIDEPSVIGGGARGAFWGDIIAAALGQTLVYRESADVGPALGAARLARLALTNEDPASVCAQPPVERRVEPNAALRERVLPRYELYKSLYSDLRESFVRFNNSLTV